MSRPSKRSLPRLSQAPVLAVLAAACLVSSPARASADADSEGPPEILLSDSTIPYLDAESADEDVRRDCDWNRTTAAYLASESEGRVVLPGSTAKPTPRKRLTLVTQTLHTVGGGLWTGPKWVVIEGTLTEDGKTIGSFEGRRQSIAGSLSGCKTVRELGQAVADDILEWIDAPKMNSKLGDAR